MKVVESLARHLFYRNLLSPEDIAELRRKGFLEQTEGYDKFDSYDYEYADYDTEEYLQRRREDDATEDKDRLGESASIPRAGSGTGKPRSGRTLPQLERTLLAVVQKLDAVFASLEPLAAALGISAESRGWIQMLPDLADERVQDATRNAIVSGKLTFDDLWRAIADDSCYQLPSPVQQGTAWTAWRMLLRSPDGNVPTGYR